MAFKIGGDPMASVRSTAVLFLNRFFDARAAIGLHRVIAHARKREVALSEAATPEFEQEATLRGLTVDEFRALVLSKSTEADALEIERQTILQAIATATSPPEVDAIMIAAGVTNWPRLQG